MFSASRAAQQVTPALPSRSRDARLLPNENRDALWSARAQFSILQAACRDPELAAGVLKLYLASLPEPLLSFRLYDSFLALAVISDRGRRTAALARLVQGLPTEIQSTLRALLPLLAKVMQRGPAATKGVATLFAPLLLRLRTDESARLAGDVAKAESITETLITEHEALLGKLPLTAAGAEAAASAGPAPRTSTPATTAGASTSAPSTPAAMGAKGGLVMSPSTTSMAVESRAVTRPGTPAAHDGADPVSSEQQGQSLSVYAAAGVTAACNGTSAQGPIRGPLSNFTNTPLQRLGAAAPKSPGGAAPLTPVKRAAAAAAAAGRLGAGLPVDEKAAVISRLGECVAATTAALFHPLDGTLVEHVARCIGPEALELARSSFPMALPRRAQDPASASAASQAPAAPPAPSSAYFSMASIRGTQPSGLSLPASASVSASAAAAVKQYAGAPASQQHRGDSAGAGSASDGGGTLASTAAECLSVISAVPAASSADLAGLLVEKAALKRTLRAFDVAFANAHGRLPERLEKEHLRPAYARLARVKRRIERVEVAAGFAAAPSGAPLAPGATAGGGLAESVVRITTTVAGGRRIAC